eukprot:s660_g18.t4
MLSPAVRKKHPFQKMCKTSLEICHRSSARQQLETWRNSRTMPCSFLSSSWSSLSSWMWQAEAQQKWGTSHIMTSAQLVLPDMIVANEDQHCRCFGACRLSVGPPGRTRECCTGLAISAGASSQTWRASWSFCFPPLNKIFVLAKRSPCKIPTGSESRPKGPSTVAVRSISWAAGSGRPFEEADGACRFLPESDRICTASGTTGQTRTPGYKEQESEEAMCLREGLLHYSHGRRVADTDAETRN